MNTLVEVFSGVSQKLQIACPTMDIINTYPADITEFPIKKPTVSVGIKTATLPFKGGLFIGTDILQNEHFGITAEILLEFNICLPKTMSGTDLYSAFDSIVEAFLTIDDVAISKITAGDIRYDRVMGAIVLEATALINAKITSKTALTTS